MHTLLLTEFCAPTGVQNSYGLHISVPPAKKSAKEICKGTRTSSLAAQAWVDHRQGAGLGMHACQQAREKLPLPCYCSSPGTWRDRGFFFFLNYAPGKLFPPGRNVAACLLSNIVKCSYCQLTVPVLSQFPQEHKTCKSFKAPTLPE